MVNLTQLWLGLLLVFTWDVVVDGDLCVVDLLVWGGLLAGLLSRDGVGGVFGSWGLGSGLGLISRSCGKVCSWSGLVASNSLLAPAGCSSSTAVACSMSLGSPLMGTSLLLVSSGGVVSCLSPPMCCFFFQSASFLWADDVLSLILLRRIPKFLISRTSRVSL